jgi:hypothetical protein
MIGRERERMGVPTYDAGPETAGGLLEHLKREVDADYCPAEFGEREGDGARADADLEDRLGVTEMRVYGFGDATPPGQSAPRMVVSVGDAVERDGLLAGHAGVWMRNTGCLGAMRRTSSSDDVALTPSKNTPTSAFHR